MCPASHLTYLQLIHSPRAEVRAITHNLGERGEGKGDAPCGAALTGRRAAVCRVEECAV